MTETQQQVVADLIRRYRNSRREGVAPEIILAGMIADGWSHGAVEAVRKAVDE